MYCIVLYWTLLYCTVPVAGLFSELLVTIGNCTNNRVPVIRLYIRHSLWAIGQNMWATEYNLWKTKYKLWVLKHNLWVSNHSLWVSKHNSWVTNHSLRICEWQSTNLRGTNTICEQKITITQNLGSTSHEQLKILWSTVFLFAYYANKLKLQNKI